MMQTLPSDIVHYVFLFVGHDSYAFISTVSKCFLGYAQMTQQNTSYISASQTFKTLAYILDAGCKWSNRFDMCLVMTKNVKGWKLLKGADVVFPDIDLIVSRHNLFHKTFCSNIEMTFTDEQARETRCDPLPQDGKTTNELYNNRNLTSEPQRLVLDNSKTTMLRDNKFFDENKRRNAYFHDEKLKPFWNVDSVSSDWTKAPDCNQIHTRYKNHCSEVATLLDLNADVAQYNGFSVRDQERYLIELIDNINVDEVKTKDQWAQLKEQMDLVTNALQGCLDGRKAHAVYCNRGTDRGHDVQYHMLHKILCKKLKAKDKEIDVGLRHAKELLEAREEGREEERELQRKRQRETTNPFAALQGGSSSSDGDNDSDETDTKKLKLTDTHL